MVFWGPSENRLLHNHGTTSTIHGGRVLYRGHGWDSSGPVFLLYVCQENQAAWTDHVTALEVIAVKNVTVGFYKKFSYIQWSKN
jgi:hypothetical protein